MGLPQVTFLTLCLSLPIDDLKGLAAAIQNAKVRSLCQDANQNMENCGITTKAGYKTHFS